MNRPTLAFRLAGAVALGATLALGACGKPAAPANPATPAGGDAADAKTFLDGLYAHYTVDPKNSTWSPMDKDAPQVFDADMVDLMAQDTKINKGEVGVIDGDYICGCQDWAPFTAVVTVQSATPTAAKAAADFQVFKADPPHHLEFDLVKQSGAWRVHDVRENDKAEQPPAESLRTALEKEIKNPPKPGADAD
jgi:hypothetical protein